MDSSDQRVGQCLSDVLSTGLNLGQIDRLAGYRLRDLHFLRREPFLSKRTARKRFRRASQRRNKI